MWVMPVVHHKILKNEIILKKVPVFLKKVLTKPSIVWYINSCASQVCPAFGGVRGFKKI